MRIFLLVLAGWLAALSSPAAAMSGTTGRPLGICFARVHSGDSPLAMLKALQRYDCTTRQVDLGPGNYWGLSAPIDAADGSTHDIRVRATSLWQDRLALYAVYADGAVLPISTTSATLTRHVELGSVVEFAPIYRAAPLRRLLWRVDGSANVRGIVLGQRIATADESARANIIIASTYSAFVGLALALLFYNLSLWGAMRHRFQLVYCTLVVALIGYAISSSGFLAWVFPTLDNNDRIRVNYACVGMATSMAIMFARAFFEPEIFAGRLGPVTTAAAITLGVSGIIFSILSEYDVAIAHRVAALMFLVGLSVTVPILLQAWRQSSRFFWIFSIAWVAPVAFATVRIMVALRVLPPSFWLDNTAVVSLTFETLVSSFAIAYRVHMVSRERDDARAGEVEARLLADADPLTGLLNRRAFLGQAIGREGAQILHLIDIDYFKLVNDTLGHDGGDEVLRVFARTLQAAVPPGGLTARLGGEEFAVLVSAAVPIDADTLLAKLRSARMPFDLRITSSVGTCVGNLTAETDWKALYRDADRALFEAKSAGRDRARSSPGLPTGMIAA